MEKYFKRADTNETKTASVSASTIISSDSECKISSNDSNKSSEITFKKSKRRKKQSNYLKSWEDDNILKSWISKSNNNLPFCKICNCELKGTGGINDMYNHAKRKKHIDAAKALKIHSSTNKAFEKMHEFTTMNKKVSMAEIQISALCAEHNISFLTMDHLIPMLQSAMPDSEIIKKLKCARFKTASIIKNVIGLTQLEELVLLMNSQPFSICVDESTDISTSKLLSMVVRTEYKGKVKDFFFALVKVQKCDATSIFNDIIVVFEEKNIDYKNNLIGFAADGANVMTGKNHSVSTLLKKNCPHLIIFKCTCHSFTLCANHACSFLPKFVEGTTREIYNFIQNSPKRVDLFADLQILLDYKPRKMLHPAQTRWLSFEATVSQILSRIDVLKLFFVHEDLEHFNSTQNIIDSLHDPAFELYLKFLKFILNDVNKLNRLFQSAHAEISKFYLKILENFVKEEYISDIAFQRLHFDTTEDYLKNIKDVYLGADVTNSIQSFLNFNANAENDFRKHCLKFYVELCKHLLKKFDFGNEFLLAAQKISVTNVINKRNISVVDLCKFFPTVIDASTYQDVDDEWREIRHIDFKKENLNEDQEIEEFWQQLFSIRRGDGTKAFPALQKLITAVLTVPIATANVERIFSAINLNKTKTRNKLNHHTLTGILLTKDFMGKSNLNCTNFQHEQKMLEKLKNQNIYLN